MENRKLNGALQVFSTCPQSSDVDHAVYLQHVADVARWSEEAGCKGILVYTDNRLVDPWLVSQIIIQNTKNLCPLVAIQPIYMHPYAVAKMIASYGFMYGRQIYLNMVAGGFKNDLVALNDTTPHDQRYTRLIEYTQIINALLRNPAGVTYDGVFYKADKLKMTPPLAPELLPGIFVSGSSEAGLAAAKAMGATAVQYPQPAAEYEAKPPADALDAGIRVGIITREDGAEAWNTARTRFPEDRKGQLTHQVAMKVSDSHWHQQLSEMGEQPVTDDNPYWLTPFQNYKTFCPYLVGSYHRVAQELARYIAVGYQTFILDIPPNDEELRHIKIVFKQAEKMAAV